MNYFTTINIKAETLKITFNCRFIGCFRRRLLTDAERVVRRRELSTLEGLGPREAELLHERLATPGRLAKRPARRQRPLQRGANWDVHGAQKKLQRRYFFVEAFK